MTEELTEIDKKKIEYFKSKLTPDNVLEDLYQLIFDFHNVSELVDFPYITDVGIALSTIKYGTIIRYDDDFDCCYVANKENNEKLEQVLHLMRKLGYKVYHQLGHGGYQIVSNKINQHWPFADIIPLYKKKDRLYHFPKITHNNPKFKKWVSWKKSDLLPRRLFSFGDFKIWLPNKPEKYLDKNFPDWRTISEYQGHHLFHNAFALVFEYFSEPHPSIESNKLPLWVQKAPKMKLKYDTLQKLKVSPEILCSKKWYYVFKSSQWTWFRINNIKCEPKHFIDQ